MGIFLVWIVGVALTVVVLCAAHLIYPDPDHTVAMCGAVLFPVMALVAVIMLFQAVARRACVVGAWCLGWPRPRFVVGTAVRKGGWRA